VILAGFLGVGKTRFLRALVPALAARGLRARVILNDLESADVDAATLRDLQIELAPVTGGCLCCETQEELVAALAVPATQPHDVVVLEANGTTDTALLLETLASATGLGHLSSPIQVTTVDPVKYGRRGWMNAIEREQVMTSSHLRISKLDLVDEARALEVRAALTRLAPHATWTDVDALADDVRAAIFPGDGRADAGWRAGAPPPVGTEPRDWRFEPPHPHEHAHPHADPRAPAHSPRPRLHAHGSGHPFVSCQIPLPVAMDGPSFEAFLRSLPEAIVRAKGIVLLREPPGAKRSFQLAGGQAEISPCDLFEPEGISPVAIFVGSGIDEAALGAELARLAAAQPVSAAPPGGGS
jgi:G3E family GTPase